MKAGVDDARPSKRHKSGVDRAAAARQKRADDLKSKPLNDEIAQHANR